MHACEHAYGDHVAAHVSMRFCVHSHSIIVARYCLCALMIHLAIMLVAN